MAASTQVFRAMVTIGGDASKAVQEYKKLDDVVDKSSVSAAKKHGKVTASLGKMKTAAALVGVTAATAIGKYAVDASRDLTESINAVNVMYGENAEAALKLGENAASGVGLSKRAFNEASVAVGAFVDNIASVSGQNTATVLDDLITRAADFGSVFNVDVDEALQRFRSGLAGETEPLRKFGINLLQSEVNAYALSEGIIDVGEKMSEEEKVFVRYRLLMEKTDKMAGDFAATSGDLANQQRILRADAENLAAEFGEALVPAAQGAITALTVLLEVMQDFKIPEALLGISEFIFGDQKSVSEAAAAGERLFESFSKGMSDQQLIRMMEPLRDAVQDSFGMIDTLDDDIFGDWLPGAKIKDTWLPAIEGLATTSEEAAETVIASLLRMASASEAGDTGATQVLASGGFESLAEVRELASAAALSLGLYADNTSAARHANRLLSKEHQDGVGPVDEYGESITGLTSETERFNRIGAAAEGVLEAKAEADEAAAAAAEEHRKAVEDLFDAIDDIFNAALDYDEAVIDLDRSVHDLADQEVETNKIMNDGEATADDKRNAMYDLREEQIANERQLVDTAKAFADEQGAIEGTTEHARLQLDALRLLESKYGDLPPEVQAYVDALNRIPREINTTVRINGTTTGVTNELGQVTSFQLRDKNGNAIGREGRASGGPVFAGRAYVVGEEGPELFSPSTNGTIIPNGGMTGVSLPRSNGSSGPTYNLTVNAGLGSDGNQIGATIIDYIKRAERAVGPGWRT